MQNIIIVERNDWEKLMSDVKDIKQKLLDNGSQKTANKKYYNTKEAIKETGMSRPQLYLKLKELVKSGALEDGRLKKNGIKYVIPHNTLHNIILTSPMSKIGSPPRRSPELAPPTLKVRSSFKFDFAFFKCKTKFNIWSKKMEMYKAIKDHRHFNKGDYVLLLNIEVVPTHNYLIKNAKKSIQVKVDIFDLNRKKYNGFQHDLNTTDFKNLMDCLKKDELKK